MLVNREIVYNLDHSSRYYVLVHTLELARTIADLAGCDKIETSHLAEAIQYRPKKLA